MESAKARSSAALQDIAHHAWQTGEPGLIFIDRINAYNPLRGALGEIKATNPCVTADTWVMTQRWARGRSASLVGQKRLVCGRRVWTVKFTGSSLLVFTRPASSLFSRVTTETRRVLRFA